MKTKSMPYGNVKDRFGIRAKRADHECSAGGESKRDAINRLFNDGLLVESRPQTAAHVKPIGSDRRKMALCATLLG
jgi:hypothetical protein